MELQNILHAFQFYLSLSVGSDDIASETISQYILLNRTLKVTYDQN